MQASKLKEKLKNQLFTFLQIWRLMVEILQALKNSWIECLIGFKVEKTRFQSC